ncbi:MAG: N-acetylmuramoyl-L-alanine amidase [Frankiales bacterium]|nr:N-acetylmuramoyl-L-alanine amidase [Frankiales bacterium]
MTPVLLLSALTPGLLLVATLALSPAASAAEPAPVAPAVQEIVVSGVDAQASREAERPLVTDGSSRRTVLLTSRLATADYGLVGITWRRDDVARTIEAWARTRSQDVWSAWTLIGGEADEAPDDTEPEAKGDLRAGTTPLWVAQADGVQVRVDVLSGPDPQALRVALVDPGESAADAGVSEPAAYARAAGVPPIRTRAQWGADESLRRQAPSYASSVRAVIVHHTASSNDYSPADVPRLLRGFYAYHVTSQGWSDIGYNLLVDRFGTVWEGRAGGVDRAVIGAHAGGFNTGTAGISMIGTFETVAPTAAQLEAVAQAAAWKLSLGGVDPRGTVRMVSGGGTKWPAGTVVTLPTVLGHRQVSATSCPGAMGYAALPALRDRIAALQGGAAPTAGGLQLVVPSSARSGATVELSVRGGDPGAAVEVFFSRPGETATKRRDAVLSDAGSYRTSFTVDDDWTVFALSGGKGTPPTTVRRTPTSTTAPSSVPPVLTVAGPVTADEGAQVRVTATGPAGSAVSVWFRREGDDEFVKRREGRLDDAGHFTTTYTADRPHDYFAVTSTVASAITTTGTGPLPDGLHVYAQSGVVPGRTVPVIVQGVAGAAVQLWFARRGEQAFTRRREGVLAADGTFRTAYVATADQTYFATSGPRSSTRETTRVSQAPTDTSPPAAPRLGLTVPPTVDAGTAVPVVVTGPAGAAVALWARRRGATTWTRVRQGAFDAAGRFTTAYAGVDDHQLWAASGASSTPDGQTLTRPVLTGPANAPLGARVVLVGRARPGDEVVLESRRRGSTAFTRSTVTADGAGAFRAAYAVDDEYEHRPVVGARIGALRRTTVAPTLAGPAVAPAGSTVTLAGTARPGASVQVWFRRDGSPSIGGRLPRDLPVFRLGRTLTADAAGRVRTSFLLAGPYRWFAVSDGTASGVRRTSAR